MFEFEAGGESLSNTSPSPVYGFGANAESKSGTPLVSVAEPGAELISGISPVYGFLPSAGSMSSTSPVSGSVSGSVPGAESLLGMYVESVSVSSAELTSGTFANSPPLHLRPSKALLSKIRLGDMSMGIVALPIFTVGEVSRLHQTNFLGCTGIPSTSAYGSP